MQAIFKRATMLRHIEPSKIMELEFLRQFNIRNGVVQNLPRNFVFITPVSLSPVNSLS